MNRKRFTSEEELQHLDRVVQLVKSQALSLRKGAEYLYAKTGKTITYEGLRKIINSSKDVANGEETGLGDVSREVSAE